MKQTTIEIFKKFDKEIRRIQGNLNTTLTYLEPTNRQEEEKTFLAGKKDNPEFTYIPLDFDPDSIIKKYKAIKVPNTTIGRLYRCKISSSINNVKLVASRGNHEKTKVYSTKIWGQPSLQDYKTALKFFKKYKGRNKRRTVSPKEIAAILRKELKKYRLQDWNVQYFKRHLVTVWPSKKLIRVPLDRKFYKDSGKRLSVHEIGVHVLRAENGFNQPFEIFVSGTTNHYLAEEGLAVYAEEKSGLMNNGDIKNKAARLIAVYKAMKGNTFRETYTFLNKFGLSKKVSWDITVRAYRGGCLTKDYIYFKGWLMVKNFVKKGGDIKKLFIGKIGFNDLPIIEKLQREKVIKPPQHIPEFFQS